MYPNLMALGAVLSAKNADNLLDRKGKTGCPNPKKIIGTSNTKKVDNSRNDFFKKSVPFNDVSK